MIKIEEDKSGRATCNKCSKKIKIGTKRLNITYQNGSWEKSYKLCEVCARATLKNKLRELDK